ncbi:MAG: SEL1-like repeat protein [Planctomycetia bacterium]|nr:SEL1-like repeat protein [Planctomycetia bacterium]
MRGTQHCYGEGVEQDLTKAVEWLTKAAEQGNEPAKEKLKELKK